MTRPIVTAYGACCEALRKLEAGAEYDAISDACDVLWRALAPEERHARVIPSPVAALDAAQAEVRRLHDKIDSFVCSIQFAEVDRLHRQRDDLLAEVRRLRALPVLRTCGQCGYCDGEHRTLCTHSAWRDCSQMPRTDRDGAPPTWCPLREKGEVTT